MHKEIRIPVRKLCMTTMHCCVGWLPWRYAHRLCNEKRVCRCQEHHRVAFEVFKLKSKVKNSHFVHVFTKLEGLTFQSVLVKVRPTSLSSVFLSLAFSFLVVLCDKATILSCDLCPFLLQPIRHILRCVSTAGVGPWRDVVKSGQNRHR